MRPNHKYKKNSQQLTSDLTDDIGEDTNTKSIFLLVQRNSTWKLHCNKQTVDKYDYEAEKWLAGEVVDHVDIDESRVAEGFLAFNIGLLFAIKRFIIREVMHISI